MTPPSPNLRSAPLVSVAFTTAVVDYLADPVRPQPGDAGFAWCEEPRGKSVNKVSVRVRIPAKIPLALAARLVPSAAS